MLTFFEYLRQRSFESVLSGAQEALRVLEEKKLHEKQGDTGAQITECKLPALELRTKEVPTDGGGEEPLPAPRRRGRPRKKAAGGQ